MKRKPSFPYLSVLLVLAIIIGVLSSVQYLLVYKNRLVESPSPGDITKSSTEPTVKETTITTTESKIQPTSLPSLSPSEKFEKPLEEFKPSFQDLLAKQAELRLQSDVTYDGRYLKIGYPLGDVPSNIGVCTDVVIRSYRGLGIDLQERVHEDMKRNFRRYPKKWKLKKPDTNIDHRRVPNLMTYFDRAGASLAITDDPLDYYAGNVVAWDISNETKKGLVHIGIVSHYISETTNNPLIIHNIGAGPQMNDMLFDYKIIGHYQYGEK